MKRLFLFAIVMCFAFYLVSADAISESLFWGHYEQDNNLENGPEEIEWIVLNVVDGKGLLRSRFALDARPYNNTREDITWENCSLRSWLNNEFFNAAFTPEEQSVILLTDVDNSKSQGYAEWDTDGGNNTQDRVFLLSYAEANRFFAVTRNNPNNIKARSAFTPYAAHNSAFNISFEQTADGLDAVWWWLRSPGFTQAGAADVYRTGLLQSEKVDRNHGGVCPVIWLDLNSIE